MIMSTVDLDSGHITQKRRLKDKKIKPGGGAKLADNDVFFDVKQKVRKTSQGQVELPILYYDTSNVLAFFICEREKVEVFLEGTELKPGLSIGKYCVVALSFYEYRKTSVGSYNEVGLAIPVLKEGDRAPLSGITDLYRNIEQRDLGFYVIDLPVTTPVANAAGRELWGYPKFVTKILFSLSNDRFHGKVLDPDTRGLIVSLDGKLGFGKIMPPLSPVTYSIHKKQLLRTMVNVIGDVKLSIPLGMKLTVSSSSDHVMAKHLRDLGLSGAHPIALMSTDKFQSRLNEGIKV